MIKFMKYEMVRCVSGIELDFCCVVEFGFDFVSNGESWVDFE